MKKGDMSAVERIRQYVQRLPQRLQAEVLCRIPPDKNGARGRSTGRDGLVAPFPRLRMRGMEDEDVPAYTVEDLQTE